MNSARLGARTDGSGAGFAVWSAAARQIDLCLFDEAGRETARLPMQREQDDLFRLHVAGIGPGARYGFRAEGDYDPANGLWFDPDKLLIDPYAVAIDRPYVYDPRLAARRGEGGDTAPLMPKAVVTALPDPVAPQPPLFRPGGLIYEINVRAFTMRHPEVPEALRGTIAALAHPTIVGHLRKLGVAAVELMPVTAWIDERHLPPLGLRNAWGYNPVSFMALDPRLAPGGVAELRATVAALRAAGIGVILDLVFNHTGESDADGPTLSLRGLDARAYYRHRPDGALVNDTGTGNTLACDHPAARQLIVDALRHFVLQAGVDGFRFDLAPVLGRTADGFDPGAETLRVIESDPLLSDRVLIAEPWDIGPGGYRLGGFSERWLEWNDRYRDDVRRFWRGDGGMAGALATRLAGSSDIFAGEDASPTRTVNFVAAHDGMTLADLAAYEHRHNEANGEDNRDGHGENFSWNHGIEGETDDPAIRAARHRDARALLATLFASRGTVMLTAGDEFGRTQHGNNNAYAQDNEITWLDWANRDTALEAYAAALSRARTAAGLADAASLSPAGEPGPDAEWLSTDWTPMTEKRWNDPGTRRFALLVRASGRPACAVMFNGDRRAAVFEPRAGEGGWRWLCGPEGEATQAAQASFLLPGRSVAFLQEANSTTG